mmetsp:Transcript_8868/g.39061  ORF Transcript_8868/g.39061 Transcript_8868/m.39061 type:complete len:300 (+) Transcript_8868:761-1660(+)
MRRRRSREDSRTRWETTPIIPALRTRPGTPRWRVPRAPRPRVCTERGRKRLAGRSPRRRGRRRRRRARRATGVTRATGITGTPSTSSSPRRGSDAPTPYPTSSRSSGRRSRTSRRRRRTPSARRTSPVYASDGTRFDCSRTRRWQSRRCSPWTTIAGDAAETTNSRERRASCRMASQRVTATGMDLDQAGAASFSTPSSCSSSRPPWLRTRTQTTRGCAGWCRCTCRCTDTAASRRGDSGSSPRVRAARFSPRGYVSCAYQSHFPASSTSFAGGSTTLGSNETRNRCARSIRVVSTWTS